MKFFRGKFNETTRKHEIGASLQVVSYQLKSIVQQNKQGAAVAYNGRITTSEAISRGSVIIAEDRGVWTPYQIGPMAKGMSGMCVYLLTEDGMI